MADPVPIFAEMAGAGMICTWGGKRHGYAA